MTALDLFEQLGVLTDVRWKSLTTEHTVRVTRREGPLVHMEVELALVDSWIPDKPMDETVFLKSFKPQRR